MYVNTAFLTMAICKGLTMAIANPSQELLMNAAFASDMLLDRPDSDIAYIERMSRLAEEKAQYETVVVKSRIMMRLLQTAHAQRAVRMRYFRLS